MRPYTERLPKSLIEVAHRPFAHYQLSWLAEQGIQTVLYCLGYKGFMIQSYVGDGSRWGLDVDYVQEGSRLRGTGGALGLALDQDRLDKDFFVLYGDSFLPTSFGPIWQSFQTSDAKAMMTVFRNCGSFDASNVIFRGDRIALYDKRPDTPRRSEMQYIDYGLLALRRSLLESEAPLQAVWDLAELLHPLSLEGKLMGYEVRERFFEIGSAAGLEEFEEYIVHTGFALNDVAIGELPHLGTSTP
jgi:NDP-sugar pyrophosphorylase family protein